MDSIVDEISRCVFEAASLLTAQLRAKLPGSAPRILYRRLLRPLHIQCRTVRTPAAALPRMALARSPAGPAPSQSARQIRLRPGHTPVLQSPPLPSPPDCEETPDYAGRLSFTPVPVAISVAWAAATAAAAIAPAQPRTRVCIGIDTRLL